MARPRTLTKFESVLDEVIECSSEETLAPGGPGRFCRVLEDRTYLKSLRMPKPLVVTPLRPGGSITPASPRVWAACWG
jgi:hypothetical protein